MAPIVNNFYDNLNVYYGDIHNHCDLSYGHGSLADALSNARLQLDFVSVTVHAVWPDLPADDPALAYLVDYHKGGFSKAQANWKNYLEAIERENTEGRFVTFPSFEWHSIEYGDYCVYYKDAHDKPILDAPDLPSLRQMVRDLQTPAFIIPHHIGYKKGSRGINWRAFTDELSPVAEIFSFHGASETSEGAYPYLHSMGPRHEHSTAQYGWSQGNIFGIVGSTDHHNAFPGSYGYGRLGVWAESLTRDALWDAIRKRRTYALTGDRIALAYRLNDGMMGDITMANSERHLEVSVDAGDTIDYIEVLHNNRIVHRESVLPQYQHDDTFKVYIEMGWAEQNGAFAWDATFRITQGTLQGVEPRFRGHSPTANPDENEPFAYTQMTCDDAHIHVMTHTYRNPSLHTSATEGLSLTITGSAETCITATINGRDYAVRLDELMTGSRTFYMGGFVSPAICFHRAVPQSEYRHRFSLTHHHQTSQRDWYYVRVRQTNNQWAWGSPIWIEGTPT